METKQGESLKDIRWDEITKRLNETAEQAREAGAGSEAEQVKQALDTLFAELKKLSETTQSLAPKKENDE